MLSSASQSLLGLSSSVLLSYRGLADTIRLPPRGRGASSRPAGLPGAVLSMVNLDS